jgi:hypothetical protein
LRCADGGQPDPMRNADVNGLAEWRIKQRSVRATHMSEGATQDRVRAEEARQLAEK